MDWPILLLAVGVVALLWFFLRKKLIPAERARALLNRGAKVVDVRTEREFAEGAVKGALNIPLDRLVEELPKQFPDRAQPLLLHCLGGVRSQSGVQRLRGLGYTDVHNLGSLGRARSIVERDIPRPC